MPHLFHFFNLSQSAENRRNESREDLTGTCSKNRFRTIRKQTYTSAQPIVDAILAPNLGGIRLHNIRHYIGLHRKLKKQSQIFAGMCNPLHSTDPARSMCTPALMAFKSKMTPEYGIRIFRNKFGSRFVRISCAGVESASMEWNPELWFSRRDRQHAPGRSKFRRFAGAQKSPILAPAVGF